MGLRLKMYLDKSVLPQPNISSKDSKKIINTVRKFLGSNACYTYLQTLYMMKNTQTSTPLSDLIFMMILLTDDTSNRCIL